jgi:hypothetical protein
LLSDDEALFAELENEEDNEIANIRERRIQEIQNEQVYSTLHCLMNI